MDVQFPSPQDLHLDSATLDLCQDVANMALVINDFRPLAEPVVAEIRKRMLEDGVYNSNAIEGNTLSLQETQMILETGAVVDVGRGREATEVLNLGAAIREIQSFVDDRTRWSDHKSFLSVHGILMKKIGDSFAGIVRNESVMIRAANYQPPGPEKLAELLAWLWSTLQESKDCEPIRLATWTHWSIARIHPFIDGNGRMARLWQDLILFGNRYSAAIIRATNRREYYHALTSADDGRFDRLAQLIGLGVATNLQGYLDACRETDELKGWAQEIVGEAHAAVEERRRAEYLRWCRGMLQLKDAFVRCAAQITYVSDGTIDVEFRPFDIIEQPTWESLRSGPGASKTWFFWLNIRKGDSRIQYCFFFAKHFFHEAGEVVAGLEAQTSLLVSEQQGNDSARRLDQIPNLPLRLREILIKDGELLTRCMEPATGRELYEKPKSHVSVAQEFISQAILHRMR